MNVTICIDMKGCPNRCKHCWIGHMPNPNLSDSDVKSIADAFKEHFENITVYSWLREPDYCEHYRDRWIADNELSSGAKPQRFELASFYKIVREPEYIAFLKEVGTKSVQLTLFGLEETTDRYVGRKGAFREILQATELLIANGIVPRWQFFLNEENKAEAPELLALIGKLRLKERWPGFTFFLHEGSCDGENAKLYPLRIRKESVAAELLPYYPDFGSKCTERELVKRFQTKTQEYFVPSNHHGDIVLFVSGAWDVFFNFTHMTSPWVIGNIKTDAMSELCRRIQEEDIPALRAAQTIPLSELAARYGDPGSTRLFEEYDYKMFLLNRFLSNLRTFPAVARSGSSGLP